MTFRWMFCVDEIQKFVRIIRLTWKRGIVGNGGYSAKLSIALCPLYFSWIERDAETDWRIIIFGIRLHYCRSYVGGFAP